MEILSLIILNIICISTILFLVKSHKTQIKNYKLEIDLKNESISEIELDKKLSIERLNDELKNSQIENVKVIEELKASKQLIILQKQAKKDFEEQTNKTIQQLKESVKAFTDEALVKTQKDLWSINNDHIKEIIKPFAAEVKNLQEKVDQSHKEDIKERASIQKQMEIMNGLNLQMSKQTEDLTNALSNKSKHQGNWGEMILESILEGSGLKKDVNYFLQEFITNEDGTYKVDEEGRKMQPDAVITYPGERAVIVDSKVSIKSFLSLNNAETKEEKDAYVKQLVRDIKNHIDNLSSKKYELHQNSLDYKLLFIPNEGAYLTALNYDITLIEYAQRKGISIIGPSTLIATLMVIKNLWSKDDQSKNAEKIAEVGKAIYEKASLFIESFTSIGSQLDKTKDVYDKALLRLKTGRGNLIDKAESMKELGISSKRTIHHL